MLKNVLRTFILSVMCIFAMSCTFLGENTGSINFALPASEALQNNRAATGSENIHMTVKVISESGKLFDSQTRALSEGSETIVSFPEIPIGEYFVEISGESSTNTYSGKSENFLISGGKETAVSIEVKVTPKENPNPDVPNPETPDGPGPEPEVPGNQFKDLTVTLSGNEGATNLTYSVTEDETKKGSISGNSFTISGLNAGTEYTVIVAGSSETHTYSGSVKKMISATESNEVSIALQQVIRKFDVSGTISKVSKDATINVIAQKNGTGEPIAANAVTYNSYKFSQLPAGTYNISVNGGNNGFVYSGEIKNVTVDANNTNITTPIVCTSSNKIAAIAGKVKLPSDRNGLVLTAYANNTKLKGNIKGESAVSITDGSFRIENLNIGTYSVTVKGESATHLYEGNLSSPVELVEGVNNLPGEISLQEILKTGGLKINWPSNVPETVSLSFDIKQGSSSLAGYPKTVTKTDFQSSIKDLTAGTYKLSLTGSDDLYDYKSSPCEVTVEAGNNEKPVTIEITKSNILRNLVVTLKNNNTIKNIKYTLTSSGTNEKTDQVSGNNLTIKDLIVGNTYSLKITGNNDTHEYAGSKNIKITKTGNNELLFDFNTSDFKQTPYVQDVNVKFTNNFGANLNLTVNLNTSAGTASGINTKKIDNNNYKFASVPVGEYKLIVKGGDDSNTYTVPEGSGTITVSKDGVTGGTNIALTATPKEIPVTKPVYYEYETAKKEFNTVTEAVSDIVKSNIQNPITIYVSGNITDDISIKDLVNIIITSKPGENAKITGKSFWINSANSQVTLQNITVSNSNKNGINIADGTLILGDKANIINTSADKDAILVNQKGTLKIIGEPQIDNKIMLNGQGKFWPQIIVNCNLQKPLATLTFFDIKEYTLRPVFKSGNNISMADIITKFTLVDSKYEFTSDGKVKEKTGGNIDPNFEPDPANRIYCVDGQNGDDASDGTKSFKTIASAVIFAKNIDNFTIKVKGPVKETKCVSSDKNFDLIGVGQNPVVVTLDIPETNFISGAAEPAWLTTTGTATIDNIKVVTAASNKTRWSVKVQGKTFELKEKAIIENTVEFNSAILLMNNGDVILNNPANISNVSDVQIYTGSHIQVNSNFIKNPGQVKVNLCKVVDNAESDAYFDPKYQILKTIGSVDMASAAAKFKVEKGKYDIDSNGQIVNKPVVKQVSTLQEFENAINNGAGIIEVTQSLTVGQDKAFTVNKNLIIKRGGSLTSGIFVVSKNSQGTPYTLSIKGNTGKTITFEGDNKSAAGPFIYCEGNLTLENCVFQNNNNDKGTSKNASAAIYFGQKGTSLGINNCIFKNNRGANVDKVGVITIDNYGVTMNASITGGEISGCTAGQGALYVASNDKAKSPLTLTIDGTKIINNTSYKNGGGLNITKATATIKNITMTGNSAGTHGGGIAINGSDVTITGSTIKNNTKGGSGQGNNICVVTKNNSSLNINGTAENINKDGLGIDREILPQ